jgi:hypothetical protein
MTDLQKNALDELQDILQDVLALVKDRAENMDPDTLAYIMNNYRKYLKINLEDEFNRAYKTSQANALDSLFNTP